MLATGKFLCMVSRIMAKALKVLCRNLLVQLKRQFGIVKSSKCFGIRDESSNAGSATYLTFGKLIMSVCFLLYYLKLGIVILEVL